MSLTSVNHAALVYFPSNIVVKNNNFLASTGIFLFGAQDPNKSTKYLGYQDFYVYLKISWINAAIVDLIIAKSLSEIKTHQQKIEVRSIVFGSNDAHLKKFKTNAKNESQCSGLYTPPDTNILRTGLKLR